MDVDFGNEDVSAVDAVAFLESGEAILVDVRESEEFRAGHAPGAHFLPLSDFVVDSLPEGSKIIAICRSGARSERATEALRSRGFEARNLIGGMKAWAASGLPVVSEDGSAGDVI